MNLQEMRTEYEDGLTQIASYPPDEWTLLVVLRVTMVKRDAKQPYHCHRYFRLGAGWAVSIDRSSVSVESAMQWALTGGRVSPDRDPV